MVRRQDRIERRSRCWKNSLRISHVLAHLARTGTAPWFQITFSKDVFYQAPLVDRDSNSFQSKWQISFSIVQYTIISFSAKGKIGLLEAHFKILEFPKFRIPFLQCKPCMARSHLTLFYSPCEIGSQGNITRKFCILAIAIAINNKPSLLLAQQTHAFCQHQ